MLYIIFLVLYSSKMLTEVELNMNFITKVLKTKLFYKSRTSFWRMSSHLLSLEQQSFNFLKAIGAE